MTLGCLLEHPPESFYTVKHGKSKSLEAESLKLSQHCSLSFGRELSTDKILGNLFNSNTGDFR